MTHTCVTGINIHDKITTSDPESPLNGAAGTCTGVREFIDGKMGASSSCRIEDSSGDVFVSKWKGIEMIEEGVFKGEYTVLVGLGKWTGATGSGNFVETFNEDRTRFEVNWAGKFIFQ